MHYSQINYILEISTVFFNVVRNPILLHRIVYHLT